VTTQNHPDDDPADHARSGRDVVVAVRVAEQGTASIGEFLTAFDRRRMARLRRLAHRIVWVDPRAAAPGFAPLAGGVAAALPFCDAFVSGHDLAALEEVVAAVGAETR
jgi:hypothetical protein